MARPAKTLWDFGGQGAKPERKIWSVTELTVTVRRLLEKELGLVWVTGEVTNLRIQSSGHMYFTVKDAGAQLSCVLFRGEAMAHRDLLKDGQKVVLNGGLTVYEPRGQYQLRVLAVELQGIGALQAAFERLKQKLLAEGLFAAEIKRPLPRFPARIGLVTSATGAAIRDILHVAGRRNPNLEFLLVPCRVQGPEAAGEIAAAVERLNYWATGLASRWSDATKRTIVALAAPPKLDLILVSRGGGSLEDLWAFNEEIVARAIFNSVLPVVSAVGHEIDFTISDFVADLRAATPSAAAEILTEGVFSSRALVQQAPAQLAQMAMRKVAQAREKQEALHGRLVRTHPRRRLQEKWQRLDDLNAALGKAIRQGMRIQMSRWQAARQRLGLLNPARILQRAFEKLLALRKRLAERTSGTLNRRQMRLHHAEARLQLLSPLHVLARGYSITMDEHTREVIREASEIKPGRVIRTKLASGEFRSVAVKGLAGNSPAVAKANKLDEPELFS